MLFNKGSMMAAVVSIILLMAVVIPLTGAFSDMSATPVKEDNEIGSGEYRMSVGAAPGTITLSHTSSGMTLKIGSASARAVKNVTIVSDTNVVTIGESNWKTVWNDKSDNSHHLHTSAAGDKIVYKSGTWTMTYTVDETSRTTSNAFTWVAVPDDEGEWLHADAPVYVDSDSEVITAGATYEDEGRLVIRGTLDDLRVVFNYYASTGEPKAEYTATDYSNELNDIKVYVVNSDITITDFIVPLQYTSGTEKGVASMLVAILPLLLACALVITVVFQNVIYRREQDEDW